MPDQKPGDPLAEAKNRGFAQPLAKVSKVESKMHTTQLENLGKPSSRLLSSQN